MSDIYKTLQDTGSPKYQALRGAFLRCGLPNANFNVDGRFARFGAGLSAAPSIDQYLDFHRDDEAMVMLGKCAIAAEILFAEANSKLGEIKGWGSLPECWLQLLFHLLAEGTSKQNPEKLFDNINIISFNYDRTIELFMLRAVMALVHCDYEEAKLVIRGLRVWHPYGAVGGYEIGQPGISQHSVSFSDTRIDETAVLNAARRLRTFTEGMEDDGERDIIRSKLATAQQIIFLGFSYLDQNMNLLQLAPSPTAANAIYGTTLGMSSADADIAAGQIVQSLGGGTRSIRHLVNLEAFSASEMLTKMGKTFRS